MNCDRRLRLPTATGDCLPTADCDCRLRPPTADRRPPTADCDSRLPTADRRLDLRRRRLDVDDRVGDLRVGLHQPILDDVREPVGFVRAACRRGTRRADRGTRDRRTRAIGSDGSRRTPGRSSRRGGCRLRRGRRGPTGSRDVSRAICQPGPRDEDRDRPAPPIGSRSGIPEPDRGERDQHARTTSARRSACASRRPAAARC